jgi:gliding motility-associated-like protein
MKRIKLLLTGLLCIAVPAVVCSQDFSNKGKDFWVAYGYHERMTGGNSQDMVLYFATEFVTTVTVTIPGLGYTQTYANIPANTVFTSNTIPKAGPQDARLFNESTLPENKGIHITSDRPIVAYAHIYNQSVSGATILFPTNTLGKEYYSLNYKNVSNTNNANCWFYVVATDTGTTTVEITPSANTITHTAGVPFIVNLTQGQVYNLMGQLTSSNNPFTGVDLTGSTIKSIDNGSGGCKKIAVFSGSGRISITCNNNSSSSDNYMVQTFPKNAWGKRYLTAPTGTNMTQNFFRILVSNPLTVVTVNGAPPPGGLINGSYYEFGPTNAPNYIQADQPVLVAQYTTSQGACGNGNPGDPEEIILSPIEQNINKVLWNATPFNAITTHFLNVVIPNTGSAISSFRLDGAAPTGTFINHPQNPQFAYLVQPVTAGPHIIQSDSGFNAIAYGFGNAESYGYNAGSNIKDLYQFITIQNPYATVNFPAGCRGTPFYFSIVFPYQPLQIQWVFGPALNAMGIADVTVNNPVFDSTWFVNGRQVYRYKLPTQYTITAAGTYPIKVIAQNPTPDGCGNEQEIDYDLQIFDPPVASFNFTDNGCFSSPVNFFDNTNTGGRPIIQYHWNFGDASSGASQNPVHQYAAPGSYTVKHSVITDVGCISDTATQVVDLSDLPLAKFGASTPYCVGKPVTFTDTSVAVGAATLVKWYWDFGDGTPVVIATNNSPQLHIYAAAGVYNATLKVETNTGCQSIPFTKQITVSVNPVASFNVPGICLPQGNANFTNTSTISSGSITGYLWDFGNGQTSTQQNPTTAYMTTGPFTVTLTATSNAGCVDDTIQLVNTIYAQPDANFTVDSVESCFGGTFNFSDQSTAANSSVTQWFWDFGDGATSNQQNPTKQYAATGNYTVTLYINSAAGCRSDTATMQVTVLQLPTVSFTTSNPVCETQPVQFTSTSVPNAGAITQYNWTVNGTPTGGNNAVINYTPVTAGNYTIGLSVLTDKGCSGQTSGGITVNPRPVAGFNLPNVCLPAGTANFTNTSTIPAGSITGYLWNFGNGQTSTATNGTTIYTNTGPFTVTLTATSNNGCTDDSVRILNTIYAQPQAAFTAPAEVCLGNIANFTDQSTAPNSTVTQWFWNFGDGTTSTLQNPTKNYAAAGTYTVTLTVTSAIGCPSAVATRQIIVNPLPAANFNTSLPACESRNITFTDASAANAGNLVKWTWNYGDGTNAVLVSGAPFTHNYAAAGTYMATLQVETNKGCISTVFSKPVDVHVLPVAGFITPEVCLTDPAAPFIDTSRISTGSIAAWQWNFGDPNATGANPNTSNLQNPTHAYTVTGSYTATLIVTSSQGCTDTIAQTFIVNGSVPVANFTVQNPSMLCSNQIVTITDASSVDFGSIVKTEIYWDYANDPTIKTVDDFPAPGKNYTHAYPEFGTPSTRTYVVRMVSYSGINCLNITDKTITVLATPTIRFDPIQEVCSNAPAFQITQAGITNTLPGAGVFSGPGVSPTGLFSPSVAGAGNHILRYTYTGSNGCSNYREQTMSVNPTPFANAGPDKFVLEGGVVQLTPALNTGFPVTYLWTPPAGLNNPTIADPLASPTDDITYTLTVTSAKGCTTSDQVFVKVLKKPEIPNIFSPNGDGIHDKWVINFLETYPGCTVEIFNRYGQRIYYSIGYTNPWDGTVNGKPVPVGTYYYIVDPKNGRQRMSGYVDVIR